VHDADFVLDPRQHGFAPIDFAEFFGNANPVVLEIGSGKGRFLLATATEHPELNVVGIEKSLHYHRVIADRVRRRALANVRLINFDAFAVLQKMIASASVAEVHIYFPDPWPRPREQKRRIVRPEVLAELRRVLVPEGRGVFVTDHASYFDSAAPVIEEFFEAARRIPGAGDPPRTNYEAKYREEGRPIYEVRFVNRPPKPRG
jgi:tRNA (guanine-N7-)-methyltransferase